MTDGPVRHHVGPVGQTTHHHVDAVGGAQRRGAFVIMVNEGANGHAVRAQLLGDHPAHSPDTATGARYEDRMGTRHDRLPPLTANRAHFPR
jgi:hypothetical protein